MSKSATLEMGASERRLPEAFAASFSRLLGPDRWPRFADAMAEEPPVSIRLNPQKSRALDGEGQAVPWCEGGFWLAERPAFTCDPLLHAGCYYVQEAASMALDHVVRSLALDAPVLALDLCAAPGGKSSVLCAALPEGSTVVSNEPLHPRAMVLAENMAKWGYTGSVVTNCYPRDFARSGLLFDLILCDAPCSGEGMFRKDSDAVKTWSEKKVRQCADLQRDILADAWRCLRPGGTLVYSTCTFNTLEDEEQLVWMADQLGAELLPLKAQWGCLGSLLEGHEDLPVMRFVPGFTRSEGLFLCAVRKVGHDAPSDAQRLHKVLAKSLHVVDNPLGDLASAPRVEVDYPTALSYLRGEAMALPADAPRGLVAIAYRGRPLGPAKNLGTRANNLYPKPWRIKTTHLPQEAPRVVV